MSRFKVSEECYRKADLKEKLKIVDADTESSDGMIVVTAIAALVFVTLHGAGMKYSWDNISYYLNLSLCIIGLLACMCILTTVLRLHINTFYGKLYVCDCVISEPDDGNKRNCPSVLCSVVGSTETVRVSVHNDKYRVVKDNPTAIYKLGWILGGKPHLIGYSEVNGQELLK